MLLILQYQPKPKKNQTMQKLLQGSFSTLQRIYLSKKSRDKLRTSYNPHRQKLSISPTITFSKSQQVNSNTIANKFIQFNHHINQILGRQTEKSVKKLRPKSTLETNAKHNYIHQYQRQIINNANNNDTSKQNISQLKKILQILKSKNNGIVFTQKKKPPKPPKHTHNQLNPQFPFKNQSNPQHITIDLNRFHPRFKHYNYSFSKKKTQHFEIETKKDWINKITKDTTIDIIEGMNSIWEEHKMLTNCCKRLEFVQLKNQNINKIHHMKRNNDHLDNNYFLRKLSHA